MSEQLTEKLGDLVEVKHGFAFESRYFVDSGPYVLLTPANFYDEGGFRARDAQRFYDGPVPTQFALKSGDLLVAMTEQCEGLLGSAAFVPPGATCLHNQRLGLVRPRDGVTVNLRYLYYLFNSSSVRQQIRGSASGATIRHTAPRRIYDVDVPKRSLSDQRRIASILGAYDDLISVNQRRLALLEGMARGLFEELVVRPAGGLPLPGSPVASSRELPRGWEVSDLANMADIVMGRSPPSTELNRKGGGFPFHQGVSDFSALYPRHRVYCAPTRLSKLADAGDILFSVRAPVGRINIATEALVLGRGVCAIRSRSGHQSFLTAHLRAMFHESDLIGNGSIYKTVNRRDMDRVSVLKPEEAVVDEVENRLQPIYSALLVLDCSIVALAASRDFLLPRLISGQLSIAAAECELEARRPCRVPW